MCHGQPSRAAGRPGAQNESSSRSTSCRTFHLLKRKTASSPSRCPARRPAAALAAAAHPPAELPAGAEAVALLEGLGADRRADLRQQTASPSAAAGSGLRRALVARAAGRRLLLGAHSFSRNGGTPLPAALRPDSARLLPARRPSGEGGARRARHSAAGGGCGHGAPPCRPHLGARGRERGAARRRAAPPAEGGRGERGCTRAAPKVVRCYAGPWRQGRVSVVWR